MTLFISIFSILMVILANHPTDSGAVQKSNLQEEVRLQRSLVEGSSKLGKKHQRSRKSHKNSAKKLKRKSKRKGNKSVKKSQPIPGKRKFMDGKFDPNFEFKACDYLDLVEVGYS